MQRERGKGEMFKVDAILAFQVKLTYFFSFKGEEISLMKTKTFHENKKGKNICPLILFKKKNIALQLPNKTQCYNLRLCTVA